MTVYLAPLEGVTDAVFRWVHHACFSGVAQILHPVRQPDAESRFTARDLSSLRRRNGVPRTPASRKDAALFLWAAQSWRSWAMARST